MGEPANISDSWLTTDGQIINPNAPAGGGGPGKFRPAGSLGVDEPADPELPSPNSPAGRYADTPDPLGTDKVVVNPPPITKTGLTPLKKDPTGNIDVQIEVLADIEDPAIQAEAGVKPDVSGLTITFPEAETTAGKVTKLKTPFIFKGNIKLQIRYAPGTDKSGRSAYGRGTTPDDKIKGNVTIGFHESCHLNDHLTWMKSHPLPVFTGAVGMTEDAYKQAMADFSQAIDKYVDDSDKNTEAKTDETGDPTRSKYLTQPH